MAFLKSLRRVLLAPLLALALVPAAPAGSAATGSPIARISRLEDKIVRCTNRERAVRGIPKLRRSPALRHAASYHARNMLRYDFFRHRDVFGQSPAERVARFTRGGRFRWVGENIAVGRWSPAGVCRAWMGSPAHRANILNGRFTMIGVGSAKAPNGRTYYVQDFGSHR
jgi:uncharacterized protein YkwD